MIDLVCVSLICPDPAMPPRFWVSCAGALPTRHEATKYGEMPVNLAALLEPSGTSGYSYWHSFTAFAFWFVPSMT